MFSGWKLHIILLLISCVFCSITKATIVPENNAVLNYTQVMFEYDEIAGADSYILKVYSAKNTDSFIVKNNSLAHLITGLQFGKTYHWYYEAVKNEKIIFQSQNYYFSVQNSLLVDESFFKTTINTPYKGKTGSELFFLDYRGIAIDRNGKPVWFAANFIPEGEKDPSYRNLRMTKDGHIMYLDDVNLYERDIKGNILWKGPERPVITNEAKEYYHHDFMKLDDGTYLTTSYYYQYEPNYYDSTVRCKVRYNTLIQYDANGKAVWTWNEKDHVSKDLIFSIYTAKDTSIDGTHLNAFDCDKKEDAIIMSCRHNSSIVKIDRKTGNVKYAIGIYGNKEKQAGISPLLLHQHGLVILPNKKLLVYNNNVPDEVEKRGIAYPKLMIIDQPTKKKAATVYWEYECRTSRFPNGIMGKGGYAAYLPNGNILACMGGANFIFEINSSKEILWEASFEKFSPGGNSWSNFVNYRSSYASSLFPVYFTIQKATKNNSSVSFTLNNEGTENDTYEVQLSDKKNLKVISTKKISVSANSAKTLTLKNKSGVDDVLIFVKSLSDPATTKFTTPEK